MTGLERRMARARADAAVRGDKYGDGGFSVSGTRSARTSTASAAARARAIAAAEERAKILRGKR